MTSGQPLKKRIPNIELGGSGGNAAEKKPELCIHLRNNVGQQSEKHIISQICFKALADVSEVWLGIKPHMI